MSNLLGKLSGEIAELRSHRWLGGWQENGDVYLWRRERGNRIITKVADVPRYFAIKRQGFNKISMLNWNKWKGEMFSRGSFVGDYAYLYLLPNYKNTIDEWYTELDNRGATPLEGDVSSLQRLMIDYKLQVETPLAENGPKVAFYDIETDDREKIIKLGQQRIMSIAWIHNGEEYFDCITEDTDNAEYDFLNRIVANMTQFDVLVGYNNYSFDEPVIEGRFKHYDIDIKKWLRVSTLDHYNLFERQGTFRDYGVKNKKLDTIAKAVLDEGKIEREENIYDTWLNNKFLLREYNLQDVRLIYRMEQKLQSVALVLSVSSLSGLLYSAGYSPAKCIDQMILRRAVDRREAGIHDFRYPTAFYRPEHKIGGKYNRNALSSDKRKGRKEQLEEIGIDDYEEVVGGLVLETKPGLYDKVYFTDFQSLYPNVIRCFNLGLDAMIDEKSEYPKNQAPNGIWYRTDIISTLADSVTVLMDERKKLKAQLDLETDKVLKQALDIRQRATKELTNSFYGATAQYGARYYNKSLAESITSLGRMALPFGVEFYEARGCQVVLGDTDSLAISIPDDKNAETLKNEYLLALRNLLRERYNAYNPNALNMELDKVFSPMLVLHKKNYVGWLIGKGDKKIVSASPTLAGIRVKKSNFPDWAAQICMKVLTDILEGVYKSSDHYMNYLKDERCKLISGQVDIRSLLISSRLGKQLEEYIGENPLIHVRIARRLREKGLNIPEFSTISYLITQGGNPLQGIDESEITSDYLLEHDSVFDVRYYWKTLLTQVTDYLDIIFPEIDWAEELKIPELPKIRKPRKKKVKLELPLVDIQLPLEGVMINA